MTNESGGLCGVGVDTDAGGLLDLLEGLLVVLQLLHRDGDRVRLVLQCHGIHKGTRGAHDVSPLVAQTVD